MSWNEIRNNTNFAFEVSQYFSKIEKSNFYRDHQNLIINYFKNYPVRGMLLFHKMGYGKSLLAAGICEALKQQVIFIAAKTLHGNFASTAEKLPEGFHCDIKYVALNASNMWEQVEKATLSPLETLFAGRLKMRGSLDGKTVVVDEAHNLFNSIVNGSQNATKLYKALIKSKCRIVFLSGSPIVNDPFEIMTCFNMLHGGALFNENYRDFRDNFIENDDIKNANYFADYITGMVSYFPLPGEVNKDMPQQLPIKIVNVVMSSLQYNYYLISRKNEIEMQLHKKSVKENTLQKIRPSSTSYRVMSRQISNFCYPEYAMEKVVNTEGKSTFNHVFEKLKEEDVFKNINLYSTKIAELMKNINNNAGIGIIYSQFIKYGTGIVEIMLKMSGIKYFVISGEIKKEVVNEQLKIINSIENKNGDIVKIIVITSTGAEGIDFKNVRHIHILEPYWHISRILQIIGRGVRLNSHKNLDESERTVQPYIYISQHGIEGNMELTTDEYLYKKSIKNQKLINSFYDTMRRASIDCKSHGGTDCYMCFPNGKKIFESGSNSGCKPMKLFTYEGKTYAEYFSGNELHYSVLGDNGKFIPVLDKEFISKLNFR